MEKLKNIFDPGHKKDENILYGDGHRDNVTDTASHGQGTGVTQQGTHAGPEGHRDGYKWDTVHQQYVPLNEESSGKHGLLGLGSKTAGTHSHTDPNTHQPSSDHNTRPLMATDNGTDASIKSGIQGHAPRSKDLTESTTTGIPQTSGTTTTLPYVSGPTGGTSTLGGQGNTPLRDDNVSREAGYTDPHSGKGGALGSAAAALGAGHHHHSNDMDDRHHESGRAFPLSGSSTAASTDRGVSAPHTTTGSVPGDPFGDHSHKGHGHHYDGDPCPHADPAPPLLTTGPHVTDTANRIDPHVRDPHPSVPVIPIGTENIIGGTTPSVGHGETRPEDHSHTGRNVALAGATAGAGLGALGAGRDRDVTTTGAPTTSGASTMPRGDHQSPYSTSGVDPRLDSGANVPTTGYGAQGSDPAHRGDHRRVGDGVTAGTAGLVGVVAGSEFSKRQAEKDAKHDHNLTGEPGSHHGSSVHDDKHGKKGGGLLGSLLHRDKDHSADHTKSHTTHEPHATHEPHMTHEPHTTHKSHTTHDSHATHDPHHAKVAPAPTGFNLVDPELEREPQPVIAHHAHDRDTTVHHDQEKKHGGGLLGGILHKDKTPASAEPHDRHHGAAPVAAAVPVATTAATYSQPREHEPVTGHSVHDRDTVDHDKEKKHGGLLGFLHSDKDKTHGQHAPEHDRHHQTGALAGAGAVGAGAVAYDQTRERELAREREAREKEIAHERAAREKELAKERAAHEKHHAKEHEKHHKAHEKEHDKHHHDKDADKEKKGGLLGFLHRDKDKDAHQVEPVHDRHHGQDPTMTGATTTTGTKPLTTADAYPDKDLQHPNKLHKDPPPGYYEELAAKRGNEHHGTDGPLSGPHSGAGLTNPAAQDSQRSGSQMVTEPHTGLPMDVGKYGDGHGGTDADPSIGGYHQSGQRTQNPL